MLTNKTVKLILFFFILWFATHEDGGENKVEQRREWFHLACNPSFTAIVHHRCTTGIAVIRGRTPHGGRSKFSFSFISVLFGLLVARRNAQAERLFAVKFSWSEMAVKQKEKLKGAAYILAAAEVTVRWNVSFVNRAWPYSVWPSRYLRTSSVGQQIEFE